jgi:hypothetical protein
MDYLDVEHKTAKEVRKSIKKNRHLAPKFLITTRDGSIEPLLIYLCRYLSYKIDEMNTIIDTLIANGGSINVVNSYNRNALYYVCNISNCYNNNYWHYRVILAKTLLKNNIRIIKSNERLIYTIIQCGFNKYNTVHVFKLVRILINYGLNISIHNPFKYKRSIVADTEVHFNMPPYLCDNYFYCYFYTDYNICIHYTSCLFERLWNDLEIATKKRRVKKFLLKYVVLNPKSKYIQRIVNEFKFS